MNGRGLSLSFLSVQSGGSNTDLSPRFGGIDKRIAQPAVTGIVAVDLMPGLGAW
jgi:hypothetical protein